MSGFDYQNGFYYYNVGEGPHRNWDDYVEFGFISAGQGMRWRDGLAFHPGDVFAAYLRGHGFVGVGRITNKAQMIRDVCVGGKRLLDLPLRCKRMNDNCDDPVLSEYVCTVEWLRTFTREEAKWQPKVGLFTTQLIRASLDGQPKTMEFIESQFGISVASLIR